MIWEIWTKQIVFYIISAYDFLLQEWAAAHVPLLKLNHWNLISINTL